MHPVLGAFCMLPISSSATAFVGPATAIPWVSDWNNQMKTSIPELMTVAEFCFRYSIGRTTLYREVAAGRLSLRKLGTATRIARADAEAWADNLTKREGEAA